MSPLSRSLTAGLLAVALTSGTLFWIQRQRTAEAASLRYANDRLRLKASQRHQAAIPTTEESAAQPASSSVDPQPPVRAAASPLENYRNEGRATPLASLQTYAWACDRGDTAIVASLLHFDAAARAKAEAYFATLPPAARGPWKTLDEMAATMLTANVMEHPFPNADILATATTETIASDRVRIRLPGTPKDRLEFQHTPNGWSYVITEDSVDAYLAHAAASQPSQP